MKHIARILAVMLILLSVMGTASAEETDLTPYGAYKDTVVVTTGKAYNANPKFADPNETQEDNVMTRVIKDDLNIDVQVLWESDTYNQKLALEFASGNLPDMFTLNTSEYLLYRQMVDNGYLFDLGSIYDQCAGDYMRYVYSTSDYREVKAFTEPDGALYGLPGANYDYGGHPLLWVRQDWLENVGLEAPKTLEELEQVLIAFRDQKGSVGLTLNSTNPLKGWGVRYNANAIAEFFGAHPCSWVRDENGKVVYGSTQEGTKKALEVLARWYQEGLIDKEFATRTDAANTALFVSGQTGTVYSSWSLGYHITGLHEVEGCKLVAVNCPLQEDGSYNVIGVPPTTNLLCVRADYEHPEVAYKLLNIEFEGYRGINEALVFRGLGAEPTNKLLQKLLTMHCLPLSVIPSHFQLSAPARRIFGKG